MTVTKMILDNTFGIVACHLWLKACHKCLVIYI